LRNYEAGCFEPVSLSSGRMSSEVALLQASLLPPFKYVVRKIKRNSLQ